MTGNCVACASPAEAYEALELGGLTRLLRAHHAGRALVSEAMDQKTDLLIMGCHCRHGVAEMLFGSTVRFVARHALCRVLVEVLPPTLRTRLVAPLPWVAQSSLDGNVLYESRLIAESRRFLHKVRMLAAL